MRLSRSCLRQAERAAERIGTRKETEINMADQAAERATPLSTSDHLDAWAERESFGMCAIGGGIHM